MNPPNILYLHTHDAGRYVQPHGYGVATPALQRLAEEGMFFRKAFCANPTCSPSRACLLTGQSAHENGMMGLAHRGARLRRYEDTLIRFLGDRGWLTALAGFQHIAWHPHSDPADIGYTEILSPSAEAEGAEGGDARVAQRAVDFLARPHRRPFFLDVGFFPPHRDGRGSFPATEPAPDARYVRPPDPLPDTEATRRDFAAYAASVATFDALAGQVIEALDRSPYADNTLVIATTDHGIAFPAMKCRLTDHGLGVMLILRGPGGFSGGKVSDVMVSHLDLFPTICEMTGQPGPEHLEGASLCGVALQPTTEVHEEIFAEVNFHAAYEPMRAVRTARWKYIRRFHAHRSPVLPNCDDGLSKSFLLDQGWAHCQLAEEELYDLIFDPHEVANLAADPRHFSTLADLRFRLDGWMRRTRDPILDGPLPSDGMIVTPVDALSPGDRAA